jgi:hypothetical protein
LAKAVEGVRNKSPPQHSWRAPRLLPAPMCVPQVHSPPNPPDKKAVSSPSESPISHAPRTPVPPPLPQAGAALASSLPRGLPDGALTKRHETLDVSSPWMRVTLT